MSICSLGIALGRIKVATETSPITLFKVYGSKTEVNAVFHSTVMTRSLLSGSGMGGDFIGTFHKNMKRDAVRDVIVEAITS